MTDECHPSSLMAGDAASHGTSVAFARAVLGENTEEVRA